MNLLWLQLLVSLWALIHFSELARLDVKIPKPSSSMSLYRLSRHPVFYDHTTTLHRGWPNVLPLQLCHAFLCILFGLGLLHLPTRCPTFSSFFGARSTYSWPFLFVDLAFINIDICIFIYVDFLIAQVKKKCLNPAMVHSVEDTSFDLLTQAARE